MTKCIAIIPARGGSKRIPRKNIKSFYGKPIIEYSIEAAYKSGCFDEVMVSTDDEEISAVATRCGAKVPFFRSRENSNDHAMTAAVLEEVLLEYKKRGEEIFHFCCIYPTAPFVLAERLAEGKSLLFETGADAVVPVTRFSYPIQRALKMEQGRLVMFWPENYNVRSQDFEPAYHDCGQFYWMKATSLLEQKKLFARHTVPLIIPESEVQDIDTEEDWKVAELKFQLLHGPGLWRKKSMCSL